MQQIGRSAAASIVIDPRRLPEKLRKTKRTPFNLRRYWVLHRRLILQAIGGLLCLVVVATGIQMRDGIAQSAVTLSNMMQGEFAEAGFGISEISMTGQVVTHEGAVLSALAIDERTSTLAYDVEAARNRLLELPAIADASIRKIYPGQIIVTLTEKEPVARWRVDGLTYLVDASGTRIGDATSADEGLPLVIGEGAADDAAVMVKALARYPAISADVLALSRIADRRWDLIYDTGLRVQLPEQGVAQALQTLRDYQRDYQILERDLVMIDMRVAGDVAVRLAHPLEDNEQT